MTVSYFEDDEAEFVYACLGEHALEGILRISSTGTSQSNWEWISRQSEHWDAVHQKIYRNFRATQLGVAEVDALPPLPDPGTKPAWQPVLKIVPSAQYAALAALLQTSKLYTREFCVVLVEDIYETSCGDGEFHYFHHIAQTENEVRKYIEAMSATPDAGYTRHHARRLQLTLDGDSIRYDLQVEMFDHCGIPEMLSAANRLVDRNCRDA